MEWHEHVADMLFMGTVVTFVLGVLYAFVYTNYRRNIRKYMALRVPGCYYYETDSEDSGDDEVFVTKDEGLPSSLLKSAEEEEEEPERKVSVLDRMRDQ